MRLPMAARSSALLTAILTMAFAGGAFAQDGHRPPDDKTIRDADVVWSKAAGAKDLDQTVSFYLDDASVLPFNEPIATGKEQIRRAWSHLMALPGYALHFAPSKIEVASSGDLAYEIGTFELTLNDAQGAATVSPGKYVVVWKKQTKGDWKVAADIFNTDK